MSATPLLIRVHPRHVGLAQKRTPLFSPAERPPGLPFAKSDIRTLSSQLYFFTSLSSPLRKKLQKYDKYVRWVKDKPVLFRRYIRFCRMRKEISEIQFFSKKFHRNRKKRAYKEEPGAGKESAGKIKCSALLLRREESGGGAMRSPHCAEIEGIHFMKL